MGGGKDQAIVGPNLPFDFTGVGPLQPVVQSATTRRTTAPDHWCRLARLLTRHSPLPTVAGCNGPAPLAPSGNHHPSVTNGPVATPVPMQQPGPLNRTDPVQSQWSPQSSPLPDTTNSYHWQTDHQWSVGHWWYDWTLQRCAISLPTIGRVVPCRLQSNGATVSTGNPTAPRCNGSGGPTASTNAAVEGVSMVAVAYHCTGTVLRSLKRRPQRSPMVLTGTERYSGPHVTLHDRAHRIRTYPTQPIHHK